MALPKPDYSFTIPSVHDDTILDCRLHHPKQRHESDLVYGTRAAIVGHPYAPLGGCYDDPVVACIGKVLLSAGYVVGTFNFRGGGASAGRTSWSAKPELADYVSFYGFMLSYLSHIQPSSGVRSPTTAEQPASRSVPASPRDEDDKPVPADQQVRLVLAGYSYGSMIASHLPPIDVVLNMFCTPTADSAEAEIGLRASTLAQLRNKDVQSRPRNEQQGRGRTSLRVSDACQPSSHTVSLGGFESESTSRRISRESSRRSMDVGVRQSLDRVREKFASRHGASYDDSAPTETTTTTTTTTTTVVPDLQLVVPEVCYLLVSPLLPPVASFTTMFSSLSYAAKNKSSSASAAAAAAAGEGVPATASTPGSRELASHPSCAVYGDKDAFTSRRKLRKWAEHLKQQPDSRFDFFEIAGASHFWQESDAGERLKASVREWLGTLDAR